MTRRGDSRPDRARRSAVRFRNRGGLPFRVVASGEGELLGKRVLVELSNAIERFALAARPGDPLLVLAMFQKLSYFERQATMYRDIAGRGAVAVVGLVEDVPPHLPGGVHHTLLRASDDLAREWSVTVLGPRGGATLVAVDQETVDPVANSLEDGRQFRGRWSFRRADAYREALRLRSRLRLPAAITDEVDEVLRAVLAEPEPVHQDWWEVPLRFLASRMDDAVRGRAVAEMELETAIDDSTERDPRTGLYTERFLERWTEGLGEGTLPIGLALLRVFGIAEVRSRFGLRAELAVLQGVTTCVRDMITDVDRVVRMGEDDFLVVLPSWQPDRVLWFCEEVCARVARLHEVFPFVALPGVAAATVTRSRPLPIEQLVRQVEQNAGSAGSVQVLAG